MSVDTSRTCAVRTEGPVGAFHIADLPLDLGVARLRGCRKPAAAGVPGMPDKIKLRVHRGGLPTMTADGEHTVGPVPGVRGLYVAGGCCVGGLSMAPVIGEGLAAWITQCMPPMDLSPLAPGREGTMDEQALSGAPAEYAYYYWKRVPPS